MAHATRNKRQQNENSKRAVKISLADGKSSRYEKFEGEAMEGANFFFSHPQNFAFSADKDVKLFLSSSPRPLQRALPFNQSILSKA
jgi:hypothetical protein